MAVIWKYCSLSQQPIVPQCPSACISRCLCGIIKCTVKNCALLGFFSFGYLSLAPSKEMDISGCFFISMLLQPTCENLDWTFLGLRCVQVSFHQHYLQYLEDQCLPWGCFHQYSDGYWTMVKAKIAP